LQTKDEVEVESEVLRARWVGRRCPGVTAGVSPLETGHWHNLSTILKRCHESYNSLFSLYCFGKWLYSCKNYIESKIRSSHRTVYILCVTRV
jgi:hypothetical protein